MKMQPLGMSDYDEEIVASNKPSDKLYPFKMGVNALYPSLKRTLTGRILPAYDWTIDMDDPSFASAYVPYRVQVPDGMESDPAYVDEKTGQPKFSAVSLKTKMYQYFGNSKSRFFSPQTKRYLAHEPGSVIDTSDPVEDLFKFCQASHDPDIKNLSVRPKDAKEDAVIPFPRAVHLFNMYARTDGDIDNVIVPVSTMALKDLMEKLNTFRPASIEARDPNWPDYLFGDPTDPETGFKVTIAQVTSPTINFNGFLFNRTHRDLNGIDSLPVSEDILKKRYNFWASNDTGALNIYTYQEIVDFLLVDGAIPTELIKRVCSAKAETGPVMSTGQSMNVSKVEDEDNIPGLEPAAAVTEEPKETPAYFSKESEDKATEQESASDHAGLSPKEKEEMEAIFAAMRSGEALDRDSMARLGELTSKA